MRIKIDLFHLKTKPPINIEDPYPYNKIQKCQYYWKL
uniref:Uncharacterized protein n=1 Tax=viral metagenome TaxID=1070528 RepID=A0A6C0DE65_9ZZZZ